MNHGSLFSGIGGFDLAAEWMKWNNVFHCEKEPFCQKVLKHHFPKSKLYEDITTTDFSVHRGEIDILTGGFPCQPYSIAGSRLGTEDDRHLWPEMLRAVQEIQPRWIVGENVLGLVNWNGGLVFHEVQNDLEAQGYEVQPFVLPAASVNAPHKRQRVWFVAYSKSWRRGMLRNKSKETRTSESDVSSGSKYPISSDERTTSDTNKRSRPKNGLCTGRKMSDDWFDGERISSYSCLQQLQRSKFSGSIGETRSTKKTSRQSCRPVCNKWENFPTQTPICSGDDGLSNRLDNISFPKWRRESIKAYGNAVVPQVVHQIFKAIEQYELLNE